MSHSDWTGFPRTVISIAVAMAALPVLAQNTTSAVSGVVTGADGRPVAGAAVTILHRESGVAVNTVTGADGRYTARGLRTGGPYTITIAKDGQTDKRDDVFLQLAETLTLDSQLGTSATVVVTGRALTDRFNSATMGAGTSIGSRELATFGSLQRSLQDYARTDPRLAQTDKDRGEISAAGQNTRFNSITIDGVTTNDTFGLEANNLPLLKQPVSVDAIQSVQVNLSNYDVTQKGYTGANINAVTKSGTNEFKGSVYYVFRDDSLAGDRYNRTAGTYFAPPPSEDTTKGFTLGGPIIKDQLFFFANYEEYKSSRVAPTFGPLGSTATNVAIRQASIDEAIAIARDVWGFDAGTSQVPSGLAVDVKDTLLKFDWNISERHRANLRYTKTEQTEPNIAGFSATGLSLSSWWWNQVKELETVVGQWYADWTDDLSTELKVSKRDYASRPIPVNGQRLPAVGLRFSGTDPSVPSGVNQNNRFLNFGTELSRHFNVLETETTDIYAGATWNRGAHELKFGVDYVDNKIYNAFLQNVNGNYTFGCEPGTYSFGTFANCNDMTQAQRDQATLENFRNGRPSAYTLQFPLQGRTLDDAVAIWSVENVGLFLQDTWKVNRALNVVFGVRLDQQNVPTKPLANTAAAAPRVPGSVSAAGAVTRDSGGFGLDNTVTLDGNRLVQPRVGFNWNLGDRERRMQLRGGFGLFQGAAANVWLSNPFSNTAAAVATLNCPNFTACTTANARFSADPDNQPRLTGTPPAPNIDFISSSLEQPSVWKASLAFDAETPVLPVVGALTVTAEWLHTKVKNGIYYHHQNLGNPTATGSDGRNLYYTPNGYLRDCWNANGSAITSGATCTGLRDRALSNPLWGRNVLLATNTSKGGGDALTVGVGQARGALNWNLAYTRTTAKEVSPLTSSTSSSNWGNRNIFNPNEEELSNSNYLTKDRVNASVSWGTAFFGSYRTSFGMFYEGRKGKPYSWTYINDLNGDGVGGNDLMYIPSGPGSGEVVFRGGAAEETRFWDIVNANPGLASAKGGIVGRNNNFAPWVNNFDMRLSQELPGFLPKHKAAVVLDIFNFGNLLNKKWGRIDEIGFPSNRSFVHYNGRDAQGRYVYSLGQLEDLTTRQEKGESQWAVQVTLRYEF